MRLTPIIMISIAENIARVKKRIESAAYKARRDSSPIKLVAVSKTKSATAIREAYEAGQRIFGENYAQEMKEKAQELAGLDIEWHFIGHLQKNKAKIVAPVAACIETIDSVELAEALSRRTDRRIPCLIEVNTGGETAKSGVAPDIACDLARAVLGMQNLSLCGLMTIPPFDPDPEKSRPYFKQLRALLDSLNLKIPMKVPLRELSMGMSHDFETAIEEGATIVRVGTAIFGERA